MLECLVNGCVVPEGELSRLILWAIVAGVGVGVVCSTVLGKALDLGLLIVERRHRIEDARNRDHSKVPPIRGRDAS
ncbi:hypothetical protein J2W39_000878 [Variovorax paradoxus]|uniref:Uncharacterized protein n=1 Tax=Variovorax paradoxus TaxID=34073 RepID=A0AAW8E9W3_VARPD|nr:hypothetical protein [Variovorax paradoxus]MDP9969650.1 hypothetical protein [Variovorax paradoxus]